MMLSPQSRDLASSHPLGPPAAGGSTGELQIHPLALQTAGPRRVLGSPRTLRNLPPAAAPRGAAEEGGEAGPVRRWPGWVRRWGDSDLSESPPCAAPRSCPSPAKRGRPAGPPAPPPPQRPGCSAPPGGGGRGREWGWGLAASLGGAAAPATAWPNG